MAEPFKNTTQLAKYPCVLYVKPSNKVYILQKTMVALCIGMGAGCNEKSKSSRKVLCQTTLTLVQYQSRHLEEWSLNLL